MFEWFRKRRAEVSQNPRPVEPACFVCDGSPPALDRDGPGHWLGPRYACRDHSNAALLSSGESLIGFLDRHVGDHPLEGSGLSWLLNPVTLAGKRAWADFAAGGWAVLEEVFASDSQFDFWAQHRPDCVDALYQMHLAVGAQAGRSAPKVRDGRGVMAQSVFAGQWELHCRIADSFHRRGGRGFTSPAELHGFWESLHPLSERPVSAGDSDLDSYLRNLAEHRFQRLPEPGKVALQK